jgi:hypothetical protein
MRPAVKLLLKLFLATGVPFGVVFGLVVPVVEHRALPTLAGGVEAGCFTGLFFGLSMALGVGVPHLWAVRKLGLPLTDGTLKVRQRRTLTLACPFDEAFTACLGALRGAERVTVLEETDYQAGVIHAVKGTSWHSWGERIRLDLAERGEGDTAVSVTCRPALPTTLVDFGSSLRLMDAVVARLVAHLGERLRPAAAGIQPPGRLTRGR